MAHKRKRADAVADAAERQAERRQSRERKAAERQAAGRAPGGRQAKDKRDYANRKAICKRKRAESSRCGRDWQGKVRAEEATRARAETRSVAHTAPTRDRHAC